jgi:pantoate--beta-alanine ligase
MRIVTSVTAMQRQAQRWKRAGTPIGFVPTMGYLHEGHISLVRKARQLVGKHGVVVVSIYVNPTQFAPTEDLAKYPRDLPRDKKICRRAGVDVLFVPNDRQMYPAQSNAKFSTFVVEESLSRGIEGASRPTHFRGVTTVVAMLFNIALPDVAVFGAKDFQQTVLIKRMVRDLKFPLKILVAPTHREPDGLAMSSRNKYLKGDLRHQATCLWRAIQKAKHCVRSKSNLISAARLRRELKEFIHHHPSARVDYLEFFDPNTLKPVTKVQRGVQMALAVFIGQTRLIDNARL